MKTTSIINRSAVKNYALLCSAKIRAGKFTRVSSEFLDDVEAKLEAAIRGMSSCPESEDVVPEPGADWFINGRTLKKAEEKLNYVAQKIILGKVRQHPSVGKTLI